MKLLSILTTAVFVMVFANVADARNEYKQFSVSELKALDAYSNRLGNEVTFYFGNINSSKVLKKYGEWPSLKKTNAFNKSDEYACQWAMLSALISLKKRALREGGNAVFIKTNNDHRAISNGKTFECEIGNIVASVAVLGTVVKM